MGANVLWEYSQYIRGPTIAPPRDKPTKGALLGAGGAIGGALYRDPHCIEIEVY